MADDNVSAGAEAPIPTLSPRDAHDLALGRRMRDVEDQISKIEGFACLITWVVRARSVLERIEEADGGVRDFLKGAHIPYRVDWQHWESDGLDWVMTEMSAYAGAVKEAFECAGEQS